MPKLLASRVLCLAELKAELERIKERDKELNLRAEKVLDYINQLQPKPLEKVKGLEKAIAALGTRLKDFHIKKLIDIWPKNEDEVRLVLASWDITLPKETIAKLVEIFSKQV